MLWKFAVVDWGLFFSKLLNKHIHYCFQNIYSFLLLFIIDKYNSSAWIKPHILDQHQGISSDSAENAPMRFQLFMN